VVLVLAPGRANVLDMVAVCWLTVKVEASERPAGVFEEKILCDTLDNVFVCWLAIKVLEVSDIPVGLEDCLGRCEEGIVELQSI
jgi:hypothetical protein